MPRSRAVDGVVALLMLALAGGCGRAQSMAVETKGPTIVGVIKDEAGAPLPDRPVQGCTTRVCLTTASDKDGRFSILGLDPPAEVAVKTPEHTAIPPMRAESIAPVLLSDRAGVDAGTLYVPTLSSLVTVPPAGDLPQTVTLGDGLTLTLRRSDLIMPLGTNRDDQLAARSIAQAHVPALPTLGPETVVAAYAFYPFGAKSRSKMGVRLQASVPAGTRVRFRTINELNGKLSEFETGRSDGTFVRSEAGAGLLELTWLVVTSPR